MKFLSKEKISEHIYKTPEGYLVCTDCILARTGKQTYLKSELYLDGDNTEVEVDRPYDEVFNEKTKASFENKPLTLDHPTVEVNVDNYKDYSIGFIRSIGQSKVNDTDVMTGTIVITDKDAIEKVLNKEYKDLSCGYDCDILENDNGFYQHNIRGNHVALCEEGRAGIARIVDSKKHIKDDEKDVSNEIDEVVKTYHTKGYDFEEIEMEVWKYMHDKYNLNIQSNDLTEMVINSYKRLHLNDSKKHVKDDEKDVKVCLSKERYAVVSTKEWRIWREDAYADFTTNDYSKATDYRDRCKYDTIILDCYNDYMILDSKVKDAFAKGQEYVNENGTIVKILSNPDELSQITYQVGNDYLRCTNVESLQNMLDINKYKLKDSKVKDSKTLQALNIIQEAGYDGFTNRNSGDNYGTLHIDWQYRNDTDHIIDLLTRRGLNVEYGDSQTEIKIYDSKKSKVKDSDTLHHYSIRYSYENEQDVFETYAKTEEEAIRQLEKGYDKEYLKVLTITVLDSKKSKVKDSIVKFTYRNGEVGYTTSRELENVETVDDYIWFTDDKSTIENDEVKFGWSLPIYEIDKINNDYIQELIDNYNSRFEDSTTKVKDIKDGYVLVTKSRWYQYGKNAIIERIEDDINSARYDKEAISNADRVDTVIIKCPEYIEVI